LYCYVETKQYDGRWHVIEFTLGPLVLGLIGLVVLVAIGHSLTSARGRQRRAAAFARRAGLPGVTPELTHRVGRRWRFVVAGTLLGLAVTPFAGQWLVPVYAGLALGALADVITRPGPPPGSPRVAHAASTRLRDYVPAWLVGVAAGAAAAAPLLALLWVLTPRTGAARDGITGAGVAWLVLAAGAGLAVSLGLARAVVRRRQPAGSPAELAIDDALRAQAVRDVLQVTAVTSFAVGWALSMALIEPDVAGVARLVGGAYPLVMLLGIAVVGVAHEATRGARCWRRRLVTA
jgi:hypothetical protein